MAPERILTAADALFAQGPAEAVTMDAVAAAAGVGKGTLFRAFGSRQGLLDALWCAKTDSLRTALGASADADPTAGSARHQVQAILAALLDFKLANRHLLLARERSSAPLQSDNYREVHQRLRELLAQALPVGTAADAAHVAHALLAALNMDIVLELLASGHAIAQIRRSQAAFIGAVLDGLGVRP